MSECTPPKDVIELPYKGVLYLIESEADYCYKYEYQGYKINFREIGDGQPLIRAGIDSIGIGCLCGKLRSELYNADLYADDKNSLSNLIDLSVDEVINHASKIRSNVPKSISKAAIQILMDGHPTECQKELYLLINDLHLLASFKRLSELPFSTTSRNGQHNSYQSILFSLINFKVKRPTKRTLPTIKEKISQRKRERDATAKMLQVLERGMSDSPVADLTQYILESPKVTESRKNSIKIYETSLKLARKSNYGLLFASSPLLTDVLKGFIWALDNKETYEPMSTYSDLNNGDGTDLNFFGTTDPIVRFERKLLNTFETYYGYIPSCAWEFLNYCFDGQRPKETSQRYYNKWKQEEQ